MDILIKWLLNAVTILAAAYFIPGIHVANFVAALVIALILGILNVIVKPVLFVLTLPITILSLGLFIFVLNALLVLLTAHIVSGFYVDTFFSALLFSITIGILNTVLNKIFA